MTTYNTGNPIGSKDPRDLYDNAENLDTAVNDTGRDTWKDRFGRNRKTMSGMERQFNADQGVRDARFNMFIASSGYQFLGDYAAGIEITEYNQIVRDSDGEFWRLSGQVELPYTTTGDWGSEEGLFVTVGDAALRQQLTSGDGTKVIGMEGEGALQEWIDREHGLTASQLGLVSGNDYTDFFNGALKDKVLSEGITEIVLDTGDITVTGTLDYAFNRVVFSGEGELISPSSDNLLQRIPAIRAKEKQYAGLLSAGVFNNDAAYSAIHIKKEIRVVLFGDSISVGSDYDTHSIPAGVQKNDGVDNEDVNNSFAKALFNEMCSILPKDVRIRFYNRSIAGYSYSSCTKAWNSLAQYAFSGREEADVGKSWRDCVIDLKPDLVIHSMGMNHSPEEYLSTYRSNWINYVESKRLTGSFDQVILTTPNPNFESADQYGDFRNYSLNASKFYLASQQRYAASLFPHHSLVDMAAYSTIKRYGFDPRSCVMDKDAEDILLDGAPTAQLTGGSSPSVVNAPHSKKPIYHTAEFTINSSTDNSTTDYDFRYVAGSIIVQFNGSKVKIYPSLDQGATSIADAYYPANTNTQIRVSVLPSGVFVYLNNQLVLFDRGATFKSTFSTRFENHGTQTVTVYNVRIFAGQFPRYSADTKNNEIFGKLTWQLNEFGGGVNHPSSVGIAEIYLPPMREFLHKVISEKSVEGPAVGQSLNNLMWLGRVSDRPYAISEITDISGLYLRIVNDSSGAVSGVRNRTRETVQIDSAGNVFFPLTHTNWFNYYTRSGDWAVSRSRSYFNASGETLGVAYPPSASNDISVVSDGVTTRYRTVQITSGDMTQTFNLDVPAGATIINASASVAVNSPTAIAGEPDDRVVTYTDSSAGSIKVIFDPDIPPSGIGRRLLIKYSYLINR